VPFAPPARKKLSGFGFTDLHWIDSKIAADPLARKPNKLKVVNLQHIVTQIQQNSEIQLLSVASTASSAV
jgi:hypothetical protein